LCWKRLWFWKNILSDECVTFQLTTRGTSVAGEVVSIVTFFTATILCASVATELNKTVIATSIIGDCVAIVTLFSKVDTIVATDLLKTGAGTTVARDEISIITLFYSLPDAIATNGLIGRVCEACMLEGTCHHDNSHEDRENCAAFLIEYLFHRNHVIVPHLDVLRGSLDMTIHRNSM
jgi:hypothetical protein